MGKSHIDKILDVQRKIAELFPECVLVGGTAVAMRRRHCISFDADSMMESLKQNFEEVLRRLEALSGWETRRVRPPILILGHFQGIDIGIRQLIRKKPLEVEEICGIKIPTEGELLRIKAWLIITRNTTRDYVDFAALCDGMTEEEILKAMSIFDECYPQPEGAEKASLQLVRMLSIAKPYDLSEVDLTIYKGIVSPYNSWEYVKEICLQIADLLFDKLFIEEGEDHDPSPYR